MPVIPFGLSLSKPTLSLSKGLAQTERKRFREPFRRRPAAPSR